MGNLFLPVVFILSIEGLIFVILTGLLLFPHDLTQLLQRIDYGRNLLLLFCFLSSQENLYMIYLDLDLYYGISYAINEHSQKYLPVIDVPNPI